jgi:CheY-like chemotaxis protein
MASVIQSSCAMSDWLALDSTKATDGRSPVAALGLRGVARKHPSPLLCICPEPNPRLSRNVVGAGVGGVGILEDQLVVLVVEDDHEIQIIVEDALTEGGFEPAIAPSGEEAVTLLKGNKGNYRALVADVNLRGRMDVGSRETRQRDRPGISHHLHDRRRHRQMALARRPQQHPSGKAVRPGAACHRRLSASHQRGAESVRPSQLAPFGLAVARQADRSMGDPRMQGNGPSRGRAGAGRAST